VGRLAGFRSRQIVKKLKAFGFEFFHHAVGSQVQAGVTPEEFLIGESFYTSTSGQG
jgi:hypothetical protein